MCADILIYLKKHIHYSHIRGDIVCIIIEENKDFYVVKGKHL